MMQFIIGFFIGVIGGGCAMGLVVGGSVLDDEIKCRRCSYYKAKKDIKQMCDRCPSNTEGKL